MLLYWRKVRRFGESGCLLVASGRVCRVSYRETNECVVNLLNRQLHEDVVTTALTCSNKRHADVNRSTTVIAHSAYFIEMGLISHLKC